MPLVTGGKRSYTLVYTKQGPGVSKAVIDKQWHLIVYGDGTVELYHRIRDPWAVSNVES